MTNETEAPSAHSPTGDPTCQQMTDLLIDYMGEEMEPEMVRTFEMHLHNCPDCTAFFRTYRGTMRATRALLYEDIPPAVRSRVRQFLQGKIKGFPSPCR